MHLSQSPRLLFSFPQRLILLSSLCSCACSHFLLDCKHKHFSTLVCFCVSVNLHELYVYVCVCVLPSVRRCSVPQAVASSRPSDYCCLLHWQINPVNNYNPSPSLSHFLPRPTLFSIPASHSSLLIHLTSMLFLWHKCTE